MRAVRRRVEESGQLVPLAVVSVTIPLSLTKRLDKPLPVGAVVSGDDREVW